MQVDPPIDSGLDFRPFSLSPLSANAETPAGSAPGLPWAANPCPVCGCPELHTDEVEHRGVVLLAECPRCGQRWAWRAAGPRGMASVRPGRRVHREATPAA